jgi:hypothetical protein
MKNDKELASREKIALIGAAAKVSDARQCGKDDVAA